MQCALAPGHFGLPDDTAPASDAWAVFAG